MTPYLSAYTGLEVDEAVAKVRDDLLTYSPGLFADGSIANPSIAFTDETTTGFSRAGAGDVRLSILGLGVVRIESTGISVVGTIALTGALLFPDGIRQTFNPSAITPGLNVGSQAGDPSTPSNGDIWYDSTGHLLRTQIGGALVSLGPASIDSSAKLAAIVGDETGSGLLVFNNAPTLIAPILGTASATVLLNGDGVLANPAYSFTSETGSGWYRAGAGDVRLSILGVDRVTNTPTLFRVGPDVGSSALFQFTLSSASLLTCIFRNTGANGAQLETSGNSAATTFTATGGGGMFSMINLDPTNGNYSFFRALDSASFNTSSILFVNDNHTTHEGHMEFRVRTGGGTILQSWKLASNGGWIGTGGAVTANSPMISVTQTWNNSGVTFEGIKLNITNTASAAASLLFDLQVASASLFNIRKDGLITGAAGLTLTTGNLTLTTGSLSLKDITCNGAFLQPIDAIAAASIDWSLGNTHSKTLSGNITFTFTGATTGQWITVKVTGDAAGVITWPTVTWRGGVTPVQTFSKVDFYSFFYDGTTYFGSASQNY